MSHSPSIPFIINLKGVQFIRFASDEVAQKGRFYFIRQGKGGGVRVTSPTAFYKIQYRFRDFVSREVGQFPNNTRSLIRKAFSFAARRQLL